MEKKEVAQQVKLGAFVILGLVLFFAAVFLIGSEQNIFSRTFKVTAVFRNVEGLKRGDNVWLSGVKVGTVSNVEIVSEGKVVVELALRDNQNAFVRRDATASIGSDGLVGNKIVIIRPGKAVDPIAENDTLNTESPTDTQELFNIAKDVGENTRSLTEDLALISRRISEGQGVVGELLNDGALAREVRAAVSGLQATSANTANASAELHRLVYEMREGSGLLPTLISDTLYGRRFEEALASIQEVSANVQVVSRNLQELSAKLNRDDNVLGALLSDEDAAENIRATLENTEEASRKLDQNMEALQHNFLFRRYFRRLERQEKRDAASSATSRRDD